jgi:DNA-binding IclR family transcriptional regulator
VRLPGARADLIDLLARLGDRPTSVAMLAKITGRTPGTIKCALSRLRADGVVATAGRAGHHGFLVAALRSSVAAAPGHEAPTLISSK